MEPFSPLGKANAASGQGRELGFHIADPSSQAIYEAKMRRQLATENRE
jgi:hypothetical protein